MLTSMKTCSSFLLFLINFQFNLFCCLHINKPNVSGEHLSQNQLYKRFVQPVSSFHYKSNNTFQSCITQDSRKGHCKHISTCFLEELENSISRLSEFSCNIEDDFVGVCCPDDSLMSSNSIIQQETVAGVLPTLTRINEGKIEFRENEKDNENPKTRESRGLRGCGVNSKIQTRIIGGKPAAPKEWPWMVALLQNGDQHYCGGTLITNRHVLTAAHCVFRKRPRDVIARLGEYDLTRTDDTRHVDIPVQEIRVHEDFDYSSYENDIAILKMIRSTVFNSYIWPICLPPIDLTFENESAYVIGWGAQYYKGPASTILMEVSVPVWPQSACVNSFTQHIPDTALCASGFQGGQDACQGDSGGPLVYQLPTKRWVNIGIVSWGLQCGEPGQPGIYTRVNKFLDWIISNARF